jgi:hypothetical protein
MKKFLEVAVMPPLFVLYLGSGIVMLYGLFDLAGKKLFFYFMLGMFFPPYGFVQGLGALLKWW